MSAFSLTRRSLLAGLAVPPLLSALPAAWAAPVPTLEFDILRKDSTIGVHRITTVADADRLRVEIETDILVRVLGITAYRYRHEAREDWHRDAAGLRLVGLSTRTDDNGSRFLVTGRADGEIFRVEGSEGRREAPADIVPASYWTPLVLQRDELLGTKRGEINPIRVEPRGREMIDSAGERVEAARYFIPGDPAVNLWFDDSRRVRRLAFESRGEFIDYHLRQLDPFALDERVF